MPPSGPAPSPPPTPMGWREAAVFCATQRRVPLSDWEMRFTHEVARYAGRPSAKQMAVLSRIAARCRAG